MCSRGRSAVDRTGTIAASEVCGSEKGMFSVYSHSTHFWLLLLLPGCQRSQNQQASRKKQRTSLHASWPYVSAHPLSSHQYHKHENPSPHWKKYLPCWLENTAEIKLLPLIPSPKVNQEDSGFISIYVKSPFWVPHYERMPTQHYSMGH